MRDATSQIRYATRRAKSDVANKLVSMFLHELSRRISEVCPIRVDSAEYEQLVRQSFDNRCPYCLCMLIATNSVIEHLDGMNRYRVGLHVPGNVLAACRKCNSEKRRDDSLQVLSLSNFGWSSFLSHDGRKCGSSCKTCNYWTSVWEDAGERNQLLEENLQRIELFRGKFPEFEQTRSAIAAALPDLVTKLYSDCQTFAETEIRSLLKRFELLSIVGLQQNRMEAPDVG